MPSAWVLTNVAIIVISVLSGLLFFYIISPLKKTMKKQQLEEIISLLINFVIFIWIGKVLLSLSVFVKDPLAILAYPSNSHAFYVAVLFLIINVGYKAKRKNIDTIPLLASFVPVFLGASFVYEFIDIMWNESTLAWGHLLLLIVLTFIYVFVHERISSRTAAGGFFVGWSLGQLLLSFILPFTTLFGYMMARWFLLVIFVISLALLTYHHRRKNS
ncbi:hypothetical protein SAMN05216232_3472 [Virgibacillus subterraneus]|uniref:Uncharacterized protein n=1 Tax=Virgibacillus subterraneus TaxID=621109 RepID=A0A1H9JB45_9BACI|nr:hypothetical protein [Virgibacillus subterraneus]SEQ84008.1 hypothetical protein SAMN05216232_3472 [Virgibacillus subterraneus]